MVASKKLRYLHHMVSVYENETTLTERMYINHVTYLVKEYIYIISVFNIFKCFTAEKNDTKIEETLTKYGQNND